MMRSLAVLLLPLAAFTMGQFVSPPILTLGAPSNTTVCGSVVISWDWTGSNKASIVQVTNVVPENEISTSMPVPPPAYNAVVGVTIDLMYGSFIWQQAAVPRGWYAFKIFDDAVGGSVSAQSSSFFVEGGTVPTCALEVATGTVGRGPTSDGFPTATPVPVPAPGGGTTPDDSNSSQSGEGINAGVIAGIVLGALAGIAIAGVLFFFLCRRRGRGFIRASRAFGKIDAEAKGGASATKSGHGRWGGLGSVDITTAANQAKASPAGSDEAAQKDFPFSSSTANGGSTAAQSRITLGDEKTDNEDDENPFKEPALPSLRSQHSGTFVQEESRVASPVSRTTSPRPAPPPPPARRGSLLSSSSSSQDHHAPPSSPPLTAQRRVSVGAKGPPPPITPRANRSNAGPKTPPPALSPRSRTASLKEFVDQNQGYAMAAYSLNNTSGQDEQARYSRHSNMPALAHAIPTAIITTPPRPPSTIGLPLTQPRRKPAPVYDIEMKGKPEGESSASTSTSGLGLSMGPSGGTNASSATLGNGNGPVALGSGTGIGLAADGDGPVHYLIPDLPPPQHRGR